MASNEKGEASELSTSLNSSFVSSSKFDERKSTELTSTVLEFLNLPGFNLKTSGLGSGRTPKRKEDSLQIRKSKGPKGMLSTEANGVGYHKAFFRFGQVETAEPRNGHKWAQKKLAFLRRIVKVIKEKPKLGIRTKKQKLTEIFFTTFPPLQQKVGLRVWRLSSRQDVEKKGLGNLNRSLLTRDPQLLDPRTRPNIQEGPPPALLTSSFGAARLFKHLKKVSSLGEAPLGKPLLLNPTIRVPKGPSKFLSLPQNELGSLWKVLPRFKRKRLFEPYQLQKLAYRQRNMLILHGEQPTFTQQKVNTTAANEVGYGPTEAHVDNSTPEEVANRKAANGVSSVGPEKKLQFNRFTVKLKERQALHSRKTFKIRERASLKIEKKSQMLRLLPGLEFWQKAHSDKKVEEYWEKNLQAEKLPSKLLVSAPTGNVIFVKSEKESQPKTLNFSVGTLSTGANKVGSSLQPVSRVQAENPKAPKALGKFRWAHTWKRAGKSVPHDFNVEEPGEGPVPLSANSANETRKSAELAWALELVNMKFFTKKMLTYSPATLDFCWKHRFSFLWNALSEPVDNSGVDPVKRVILRERKNLPKVCSDLRKLLSPLYELLFREVNDPQKFFVSGQVNKKEWPIQKDGSKSYFALLNLGKMPFMTKQGNFLINGSARVLVSQIAKCPNFYTKMKIDSRGRPRYWTEFVSSFKNAGEWIQFHIDLENKMFFSLGTKRKYSIFIFLGALGISPAEIPDVIEHWDFLKQSIHKEEILSDKNQNFLTYLVEPLEVREARILFHDTQNYSFYPGWEKTDEELQKFFEDMFYNPARYFLGHAGREALNQRRRFSGTPSRSRALEKEDFLAAINALIEVRLGLAPPDDIDHLKYRRVRLPGELLQNEFHLALDEIFTLDLNKFREGPLPGDALDPPAKDQRRTIFPSLQDLEQKIFEKGRPFSVSKTIGIQSTYQVSPLEKRMRNFFHTGQLSQYMDQTNPLAEITHKRRLTSLGPDGLPKQVGVAVRELHPSHFGRICPIETPEGLNAGLVASLSSQAQIGSNHTLLAPYYWVKDRTREFPQKIFNNDIPQSANKKWTPGSPSKAHVDHGSAESSSSGFIVNKVDFLTENTSKASVANSAGCDSFLPISGVRDPWIAPTKYPPILPEIIFLSASAEDSVYICSEDYWFSSKYKNFETVKPTSEPPSIGPERSLLRSSSGQPTELALDQSSSDPGNLVGPSVRLISGLGEESWLKVDSKNSLVKFQTVFPARYQQEFFTVTKSQIDFFGICPTQMISVGTSLIPFLEHDDANRALMGSNMQRQALPLLVLERPIVGTGSEKGVAQSSNSVLLSEFSGQVSFADGRKIVVDSFPKTITSFPQTSKTTNSRLLLGSFEKAPGGHSKSNPLTSRSEMKSSDRSKFDLEGSSAQELEDVFPFGRRNLFGKFQNRTEDGKVKTIRRIFTVKIQIDQAHDLSQRSGLLAIKSNNPFSDRASKPTPLAAFSDSTPVSLGTVPPSSSRRIIVKVFPISEEEYEKSRTLLRREFIKKYKEIQNKKVFPGNFWPGEKWKKTGEDQKQSSDPGNLVGPSVTLTSLDQSLATSLIYNSTDSREWGVNTDLAGPPSQILPIGTIFHSEAVKRIRYKKSTRPQAELKTLKGPRAVQPEMMLANANQQPTKLSTAAKKVNEAEKVGNSRTGGQNRANFVGCGSGEKQSFIGHSSGILKKKMLQSSILPLKAGRLFFEPTPQMIFKNILSKNSKKREILRKALINQSFIKTSIQFEQRPSTSGSVGLEELVKGGPAIELEKGLPTSVTGQNQKVSWSVSMKKVTPYTQVTYNVHRYWRTNQNTLRRQRPAVRAGDWVAAGDLLADSSATRRGELCVGQNILVGYVPWEGYNFEDAIVVNERLVEEDVYTSILIDRYEMEASIDAGEKITRKIPDIKPHLLKNLDSRGIICVGTWVEEDDILVGKILPVTTELQGYSKLLADIYQIAPPVAKDVSFRVPDRVSGRILESSVSERIVRTADNKSFSTPWKVTLYLVEKRRMKLGDKMSGRHGNKGIVSIILPPQDMPFLPDGTPLDVALNPLGVPSRMNVGQLLESLLGLAGHHLKQKYRIPAFDEMYGEDFSRRIVYDKLLEASQKSQKPWLFNPNFPGKMMLRDGRTGEYFHQPVLVGYPYMLKLIHMVDDKMHARATGPYTMVTQQPLKGRANRGGQRIGEMEVWAVEAFAASYALQELLTLKSDDITGRNHFLMSFLKRKKRTVGGIPDAFRVLMHELQSLCFHVHYTEDYRLTYPTLLESSKIPETPIPGTYGRGV